MSGQATYYLNIIFYLNVFIARTVSRLLVVLGIPPNYCSFTSLLLVHITKNMGILLALPSDICIYILGEWCTISQLSKLDAATICNIVLSPLLRDMLNSNEFAVHFHHPMFSKRIRIPYINSLGCEMYYKSDGRLINKLNWIKLRNVQTTELCLLKNQLDNVGTEFNPRSTLVNNLLFQDREDAFLTSTTCSSIDILKLLQKCPIIKILRISCVRVIKPFDAPLTLDKLVILHLYLCSQAMMNSIVLKSKNVEQLALSASKNEEINFAFIKSISTVLKRLRYALLHGTNTFVGDHFVEVIELFVERPDSVIVEFRVDTHNFTVGAGENLPKVGGYKKSIVEDRETREHARALAMVTKHKKMRKDFLTFDYK